MDTTEIVVVVAGVALIAFVLWYFFGERERVAARAGAGGVQEIDITIKGGYSPDVVVVRAGTPVRLNFYRDETASCSERVVFGDFGVARDLPAFKTTPVEFTPERAGEFTWTCGMSMMRGKLVVEPPAGEVPTRA
jgi:plastocyanin domain-containing protein